MDARRRGATLGVATMIALSTSVGVAGDRPGMSRVASANSPRHFRQGSVPQDGSQRLDARVARRVAPHCRRPSLSPTPSRSWAAVVRRVAVVRSRPGGDEIVGRYSHLNRNRYPTFFAILGARGGGCQPAWLRVQVSGPPNGATGWVRPWLVEIFPVDTRIVVDLSLRRLVLYRSSRAVLSAPVGIGTAATPTPTGTFFVDERWRILDPGDPLGVAALGLSAHSNVLPDWSEEGPIALHGTNEPSTVGQAASHGCIRLHNADMRRLLALAPAGTPVTITD